MGKVPAHILARLEGRNQRKAVAQTRGRQGAATNRVSDQYETQVVNGRKVLVKRGTAKLDQGARRRDGIAAAPPPAARFRDDGQDLLIGTGQQLANAAFTFIFQSTSAKLLGRLSILSTLRGLLTRYEVMGNSLFASNRLNVAGNPAGFPLGALSPLIRTDESNYTGVPTKGGIDMVVAGTLTGAGDTTGCIATDLLTEEQSDAVDNMRPGEQMGASMLFGFGEILVPLGGTATLEVLCAKACVLGRLVLESDTALTPGDMLLTDADVARRRLLSNNNAVDVALITVTSDDQRGLYIGKYLPAGEPATLVFQNTTAGNIIISAGCFIDQG